MADCQNCGCNGCKCPKKDFLLVTYSYVVDDRNPFRSFFNQEGTPMHLVTTALRLAQDFVVLKSGMGRDCWQLLCEQTHKVRTEADYCLPPCLAALRDKLIWCIVSQAKYEYIKERGHDNADNARDEKLDIKERMILFDSPPVACRFRAPAGGNVDIETLAHGLNDRINTVIIAELLFQTISRAPCEDRMLVVLRQLAQLVEVFRCVRIGPIEVQTFAQGLQHPLQKRRGQCVHQPLEYQNRPESQ